MAVIWKRINDTGKNWRHVYKVCNFYEFFFKLTCGCYVFGFLSNFHVISTLSFFSIFTKWLWYWNLKKLSLGNHSLMSIPQFQAAPWILISIWYFICLASAAFHSHITL